MIIYSRAFLTDFEADYFIDIFESSQTFLNIDNVYRFYYLDIINTDIEVNKFQKFFFKKFRIQKVNETIDQVETPHLHKNPWSFIIFLNDSFEGGEVVFQKRVFKPKKGDMIYFSGDEAHKVNNSTGNRYTLVGFMHNDPLKAGVSRII